MDFNPTEYRVFYDAVKRLGKRINDSYPYMDADKIIHASPQPLEEKARTRLEEEVKELIQQCKLYLDLCGMRIKPPLWGFILEDQTTHMSHETFKHKRSMQLAKLFRTNIMYTRVKP